jgi:putrescine---pyruvate transaminase
MMRSHDELVKAARRHTLLHFAVNDDIARQPKIFVRGEGMYLWDDEGNKYLDTFASLLTTVSGHHRPEIHAAVQKQMEQLEFFPSYHDCYTMPAIELAEKLAQIMPGDLSVSFIVCGGSEANESAMKMARQYFWEKDEHSRTKILAKRWSYAGATMAGVSATGIPWFWETFAPRTAGYEFFNPEWHYYRQLGLPEEDAAEVALKDLTALVEFEGPNSVAAILMDPVSGSNTGFWVPSAQFMHGVRDLCDKYGILLIFDEVQVAFAKTGKWFCCENWDVVPDIMTIGKGFGGGYLPIAATVTTPQVADVFARPGSEFRHGFTFGGHTTACAAALENIAIIERENLVERTAEMGRYLRDKLEQLHKYSIVGDVRGIGLLLALELLEDRSTWKKLEPEGEIGSWIRDRCYELGMILRNNEDILVFAPSLTITKQDIDLMVGLMEQAIAEACEKFGKI